MGLEMALEMGFLVLRNAQKDEAAKDFDEQSQDDVKT